MIKKLSKRTIKIIIPKTRKTDQEREIAKSYLFKTTRTIIQQPEK